MCIGSIDGIAASPTAAATGTDRTIADSYERYLAVHDEMRALTARTARSTAPPNWPSMPKPAWRRNSTRPRQQRGGRRVEPHAGAEAADDRFSPLLWIALLLPLVAAAAADRRHRAAASGSTDEAVRRDRHRRCGAALPLTGCAMSSPRSDALDSLAGPRRRRRDDDVDDDGSGDGADRPRHRRRRSARSHAASATARTSPRRSLRPDADGNVDDEFVEEIRQRGFLKVGVDENTLGFSARDPGTGEWQGFEVELATR